MRNFLRFLFSGNDVHKIITPLQVEDVLPVPVVSPAPGSMKLVFRQYDPGPVQIKPLFPGSMRFIVDPAADGVLPGAAEVDFTSAAYAGWKTLGRLLITVEDKRVSDQLLLLAPDLPVKPNRIWYGPIRIPEGFLFNTLRSNLERAQFPAANGQTIRTNHPDWAKHAVAAFLEGRYAPKLRLGADATQDDVIRFVMPVVEVPAGGDIELFVTTAYAREPQDGPDADFDDPANQIPRDEPLHPRNGLIPAREVYRQLRASMVEEAASEPLRDAILARWPNAPRFFAIQFTRTWERIPNCSAHFTRHTARVQDGANVLMEQRLPAHGVLFLRQAPANPQPAPPNVQVSLIGGDMTWLLGGGTSWRNPGQKIPVGIDLGAVAQPHIAVRLPMSKAMFSDTTRPNPGGLRCTYLSLRRAVRALVDNRIAGGRLNFGVAFTSAETRGIIQRAFGAAANVNLVANNAPDPYSRASNDRNDDSYYLPRDEDQRKLLTVLSAFFPNPAPQQPMPGAPAQPTIYDKGEMAYRLWQTITDSFEANETKRNFSDAHIGRGGPGAVVALSLATFRSNPNINDGNMADDATFDQVVQTMLADLRPGATLQFWASAEGYLRITKRNSAAAPSLSGHSPIFVRFEGPANAPTGIVIIDQFGETLCPVFGALGHRRIDWDFNRPWIAGTGWMPELWIAANWDE